jgi:hypothetical protein
MPSATAALVELMASSTIRTSITIKGCQLRPRRHRLAQQIYSQATLTQMCLRYSQGEAMEKILACTEFECEGFMRS